MQPVAIYYSSLNFDQDCLSLLENNFELVTLPNPDHNETELLNRAELIFAPLGWYWGFAELSRCARLRVIASNTTGHPHIDVSAAARLAISVITLKGQDSFLRSITPTAEHALGLIISLTRNYRSAMQSVLDGKWNRYPYGGEKMLSRSTLGVVGLGRLGSRVAEYGIALGMKVLGYDPYEVTRDRRVEQVDSLRSLVSSADIVTVHVPHEPETENMFDREVFASFQKRSYFVNTSRGELVDTLALLDGLNSGHLAGAALDVLDGEFTPIFNLKDSQAWQYAVERDNLILTPHIGGSTKDSWRETQRFVVKKAITTILDSRKES